MFIENMDFFVPVNTSMKTNSVDILADPEGKIGL